MTKKICNRSLDLIDDWSSPSVSPGNEWYSPPNADFGEGWHPCPDPYDPDTDKSNMSGDEIRARLEDIHTEFKLQQTD